MISVFLLLAAFAQQPAAPAEQRSEVQGRLDIPDEIAPAIVPYVRCKIASAGIEIRSSLGGPVQRPSVAAGADCTQARAQAATRADQMLRDQRRGSEAERNALIERTLASVDAFLGGPLSGRAQLSSDRNNAPNE